MFKCCSNTNNAKNKGQGKDGDAIYEEVQFGENHYEVVDHNVNDLYEVVDGFNPNTK